MIYRTEREKWEAVVEEIERMHKWDVVLPDDGDEILGTIQHETDESIEIQPEGHQGAADDPQEQDQEPEAKGRPILVGTVAVEKSERLSGCSSAGASSTSCSTPSRNTRPARPRSSPRPGRIGAVTIATNMAGRGTDIILGGNPETLAWAQLKDKYDPRSTCPKANGRRTGQRHRSNARR